jgi:phosphoribosylformylglycinamidine synthase
LKVVYDQVRGVPPQLDLESERALQELIVALSADRVIRSAHDCSDGGVAMALAECCFGSGARGAEAFIGAVSVARDPRVNQAAALFGESSSRVIVSASPEQADDVLARAGAALVPAQVIGTTGGPQLRISVGSELVIDMPVGELERIWTSAIERYFIRRVA